MKVKNVSASSIPLGGVNLKPGQSTDLPENLQGTKLVAAWIKGGALVVEKDTMTTSTVVAATPPLPKSGKKYESLDGN